MPCHWPWGGIPRGSKVQVISPWPAWAGRKAKMYPRTLPRSGALARRLREWLERAAQRRRLLALDERALKDIGVSRAEALTEGGKPFWRP